MKQDPISMVATTTQRIRFGRPKDCRDVEDVVIQRASACPLLYKTGSIDPAVGSHAASNERFLREAVEVINELCSSGSLNRVSVRGWASTLNSVNPTNEQLAQGRAQVVTGELEKRISKQCRAQIHSDSVQGTRAVTTQFGSRDEDNQCAQVLITRHTCKQGPAASP